MPTKNISIRWPNEIRRNASFVVGVPPTTAIADAAQELLECLQRAEIHTVTIARNSLRLGTREDIQLLIEPIILRDRQFAKQFFPTGTSPLSDGKPPEQSFPSPE